MDRLIEVLACDLCTELQSHILSTGASPFLGVYAA
ncbi:hypothetical protein Enr13x_21160 [Stieleria neptunia]|uniref:Uncharacterized protein n=1 Tax=Stieleria neptunia TaxID=2527979 RepID=A0A518HN34_9BACT|nr:hypothetical protein Enr13x_21160 [Stieleria neptunia]